MITTRLFQAHLNTSTNKIQCFMTALDGARIELAPFDNTQQGIIGALLLAADINAGKFIVKSIEQPAKQERLSIVDNAFLD